MPVYYPRSHGIEKEQVKVSNRMGETVIEKPKKATMKKSSIDNVILG